MRLPSRLFVPVAILSLAPAALALGAGCDDGTTITAISDAEPEASPSDAATEAAPVIDAASDAAPDAALEASRPDATPDARYEDERFPPYQGAGTWHVLVSGSEYEGTRVTARALDQAALYSTVFGYFDISVTDGAPARRFTLKIEQNTPGLYQLTGILGSPNVLTVFIEGDGKARVNANLRDGLVRIDEFDAATGHVKGVAFGTTDSTPALSVRTSFDLTVPTRAE